MRFRGDSKMRGWGVGGRALNNQADPSLLHSPPVSLIKETGVG
jgi:hypothetical protein